jgi:hypothetical protein
MIIINSNDYRAAMGELWRPGMLAEAMRIAGAVISESIVILDTDYDFVTKHATSKGLDLDKVIAFVGLPVIDYEKHPEMEDEIKRYTDNNLVPCVLFETNFKSLEEIVAFTIRITKLKAFI